ncbi:MAG: PQQ-dependent sugar dehydrogenase [Thermoanaerobaculia bacterium]|nr:PQQ-dependent sugar dehydrogenase [Thermoanaerobaculia bacterium]
MIRVPRRPARRPFAPAVAALAGTLLALAAAAPAAAALQVSPLITGLNAGAYAGDSPIAFVDPDDGSRQRLVVMHNGRILSWGAGGLAMTPFLDLSTATGSGKVLATSASSERGLLALAVDPNYPSNRFFYVYYTSTNWDGAGPIAAGDIVVERYQRDAANPFVADPASATVVLYIPHSSASNHNGGWLAFGPDGHLWISTGDGGGGCDSTGPAAGAGDPTFPAGNAWRYDGSHYNPAVTHPGRYLLGKMLRLDVTGDDFPADPLRTYRIPADNPYAGATFGADEIWARGLRNPFRFSFDRATGDLWIGDVGQGKWEEVNLRQFGSPGGDHYGWVCREGLVASSVSPSGCSQTNCPANSAGLEDPVYVGDHANGWCSVIGGYRYRGSRVPGTLGDYLFADYCHGDLWGGTWTGAAWSFSQRIAGAFGVYSLAEDHLGELYLVNGSTGTVSCLHDGPGCFWSLWTGLGEDGFESGDLLRWHASAP